MAIQFDTWDTSITNELEQIKNAIYGKDVRQAIHDGVEKAFDKADNAENFTKAVKNTYDGVLLEWESDPNKDPELIDARGTEEHLNDRLIKFDAELGKKATETDLGRVTVDGERIAVEDGRIATRNNMLPVNAPAGFDWQDHPLVNKIFTDGYGNYHVKDFDLKKYKPMGKTYYVDIKNGSDTNDGLTLQTAFQSRRKALETSDATVIKFAEGIYGRPSDVQHYIQRDLAMEAIDGHSVYFVNSQGPSDFTLHSGNVYHSTSSGGDYYLDPSQRDAEGDFVRYAEVDSLAEVEATPGSYMFSIEGTYIHTFTGDAPEINVNFVRLAAFDNIRINGGYTFYMKGINVIGGTTTLRTDNPSGNPLKVYIEDCHFRYSRTTDDNVVSIGGAEIAVFKNCSAKDGLKDGFNYYTSGDNITRAIEINCVGKRNGTEGSDQDQGSTMHQGGKIIRINGVYAENHGANIGDTHPGTQSWNIGCVAYTPLGVTATRRINYHSLEGEMWVEGSLGYDVAGGQNIRGGVISTNNNFLD